MDILFWFCGQNLGTYVPRWESVSLSVVVFLLDFTESLIYAFDMISSPLSVLIIQRLYLFLISQSSSNFCMWIFINLSLTLLSDSKPLPCLPVLIPVLHMIHSIGGAFFTLRVLFGFLSFSFPA